MPEIIEQLQRAFREDDAGLLRKLIARHSGLKARINDPVGPFDSPMITCVRSRDMLDALLEAGANIDEKSRWWAGGFGLLHSAEPRLAAYAIERGAVVDVHAAARLGMIEKLREIVASDPALVHARGGDGQTPLHFASTVEAADFLLDHGADINARDIDHESTPAQYMVRDRQEIVRCLIRRGCDSDLLMAAALRDAGLLGHHLAADPDCIHLRVTDEYFPMINPRSGGTIYQWTLGWYVSPHDVAKEFGHHDIVALLMERSPPDVRLIAACWANDEAAVHSLLRDHPGLVSTLSDAYRKHTAYAARNNISAAVRLMLASGLPVDSPGQHHGTPLHWAAFHGNADMAREILRFHPPLEVTDADFNATPLGWAIHGSQHHCDPGAGDYPATVGVLLRAGAVAPDKETGGSGAVRTALHRHGTGE